MNGLRRPKLSQPWASSTSTHARRLPPLWSTAKLMYNRLDDGLSQPWHGRVWLNPPYSRPLVERFIRKMADHNNGIALLFNRCDNAIFHDLIFLTATALLFLRGRIRFYFYRLDGTQADSSGCGSVLVAWGKKNALALKTSTLPGKYIPLA